MVGVRHRAGFTLVELVVVMIVSGIVASSVGVFMTRPTEGYNDLARRTTLVDAADLAARRLARDVRRALPNSLRVAAGGAALELMQARTEPFDASCLVMDDEVTELHL